MSALSVNPAVRMTQHAQRDYSAKVCVARLHVLLTVIVRLKGQSVKAMAAAASQEVVRAVETALSLRHIVISTRCVVSQVAKSIMTVKTRTKSALTALAKREAVRGTSNAASVRSVS